MSSKDKKLVNERLQVPAYGDQKIEEAKGELYRVMSFVNSFFE